MGMYNNPRAKAGKQVLVLGIPDAGPIVDATVAMKVGAGNLCRIKGTAGGFISFGNNESILNAKVLDASAIETLETELGYFIVAATGDYIKTSATMRIEIIKD